MPVYKLLKYSLRPKIFQCGSQRYWILASLYMKLHWI